MTVPVARTEVTYGRGVVDPRAVLVARRAAEQALAADLDLPADLRIWALAGGRPEVRAVPGDPEELGGILEATMSPGDRRRRGAHYTPSDLAAGLVERALGTRVAPVVGDPACGGGALLLAAARHLAAAGCSPRAALERLWGVDLDPVAIATTEVALTLWAGAPPPPGHLAVADALLDPLGWPLVDVVVGNPPFLGQLDATTAHGPDRRQRLRDRFGPAALAYTDAAGLFLVRACQLAAENGLVALVQPQSVLGARDAAGVRVEVAARGRLQEVWLPADPGFAARVHVCVAFVAIGAPDGDAEWTSHLARAHGVPEVAAVPTRCLADEATATAGFRSEFYGLARRVREADDLPAGRPLVTTGLIDLGGCAWGVRPARIAGRSWARPVVDPAELDGRAADWAARTGVPKLVVASQTRVVEVAVDEEGTWIPGVPLVAVLAAPDRLWPLAAALAAPAVSAWLLHRVAGTALAPGALRVSAALLRQVPLPVDDVAWAEGTEAFRARDLDRFVLAMGDAYGVGSHVGRWWRARAEDVWSPVAPRR